MNDYSYFSTYFARLFLCLLSVKFRGIFFKLYMEDKIHGPELKSVS